VTPDQVVEVLETAVRAPSVHNTQPWLFDVDGDAVRVRAEQQPDRVLVLEGLVARADRTLRADADVRDELRGWVRPGPRPVEGVPVGALPDHGRDRGSSLALRDFDPDDAPPPDRSAPPVAEHPLLLVLSTDGDGPEDWARAGGALTRVLLTATAAGLVADPQTQVLEVAGLRWRLVDDLGLVGLPQMVLRVGHPTGPGSPATGRRPVSDVTVTS
jgi:Nitroreductase family